MVVFPHMVVPLMVGRSGSLAAVEEAIESGSPLLLVTQRDASVEAPESEDLHRVGVVVSIGQTLRMPDGALKIVVEGLGRAAVRQVFEEGGFLAAEAEPLETFVKEDEDTDVLKRLALNEFAAYAQHTQRVAPEVVATLREMESVDAMADMLCAYLQVGVDERQDLLAELDLGERLRRGAHLTMREVDQMKMEQEMRDRVREQMDRSQRDYLIQEQIRMLRQELGGEEGGGEAGDDLRQQVDDAKLPAEVRDKAYKELARYERLPAMTPESALILTYIEWLVELPWRKRSRDRLDLETAETVLNEDHFGLKKVKERILEFLAVRKLSRKTRGPVLCFVGPPGVGKTSLGQSIARAMQRKFIRVSLGGVRDEAEIRGHRRTYIGALPGRIIQNMKKAGVRNPVFMLDEIDKMSMDFRGDPSAALLEVLDPEQNTQFSDHYLEVDFDLSEVFFITTANNEYEIPDALYDRLEIVRLSGYTAYEKRKIAEQFLVPKRCEESGLKPDQLHFTEDGIDALVRRYTREAGVRELSRQVAGVARKVARKVVAGSRSKRVNVNRKAVREMLGPEPYADLRTEAEPDKGVAVGLAWTWDGGDILLVETSIVKGKGHLTLTGSLGDILQESAQAAHTYLRARAKEYGIPADFHTNKDIHIHLPEGAIPKDGPSAGVPLTLSLLSALRGEAPKSHVAATGEITLRGKVLPVGGVKEKLIAAHRAGMRRVALPKENEKDLEELPPEVKRDIEFMLVEDLGEVIRAAFGEDLKSKRKPRPKSASAAQKTSPKRKSSTKKPAPKSRSAGPHG
jgi:ATP-dependent Lon protease